MSAGVVFGAIPTIANIEYANIGGLSLKLDVYLPQNGIKPYPVIVWIHGGGWSGGTKDNPTAAPMTNSGYAVVSIDYRSSRTAIFPAQIHDCKAAVRWLRANASTYDFDSERIGAWGSSAGGHLSALLGTTGGIDSLEGTVGGNLQYSSRVQAVCDWYGPADLTTIYLYQFPAYMDHTLPTSFEAILLGGTLLENLDKAAAASPLTYVSSDEPPFLIQHGTLDSSVPIQQSFVLDSALDASGVNVVFIPIVNAGHGGPGFTADTVKQRVYDFFNLHFKSTGTSMSIADNRQNLTGLTTTPNPFSQQMSLSFLLDKQTYATLKIFDIQGKEIAVLSDGFLPEGLHERLFDAKELSRGVYFGVLQTDGNTLKSKAMRKY
jgi:acetyl esterase/lipase